MNIRGGVKQWTVTATILPFQFVWLIFFGTVFFSFVSYSLLSLFIRISIILYLSSPYFIYLVCTYPLRIISKVPTWKLSLYKTSWRNWLDTHCNFQINTACFSTLPAETFLFTSSSKLRVATLAIILPISCSFICNFLGTAAKNPIPRSSASSRIHCMW
jgi:hypothetical protein